MQIKNKNENKKSSSKIDQLEESIQCKSSNKMYEWTNKI